MDCSKIIDTVASEGLIGLQRLEAEGVIVGDFPQRKGHLSKRDEDADIALAIATGIGRHDSLETVTEMIEWLRDGEYLIDYGYITVSLAESAKDSVSLRSLVGSISISDVQKKFNLLQESKHISILEYFRQQIDDKDEIFCLEFLLDYSNQFCKEVNQWLLGMKKQPTDDTVVVKTSCGYSYCWKDDFPDVPKGYFPYVEWCYESGLHFNRYRGYCCTD